EFYLQAGLVTEAAGAIGRLREAAPDHPSLAAFDERLGALLQTASPISEEAPAAAQMEPIAEAEPETLLVETPAGAITIGEPKVEPEPTPPPVPEPRPTPEPLPAPTPPPLPTTQPKPEPPPPRPMAEPESVPSAEAE